MADNLQIRNLNQYRQEFVNDSLVILIPNISRYRQVIEDNVITFVPIVQEETYMSRVEMLRKDFTDSKIISCSMNGIDIAKKFYKSVLIKIYENMDTYSILENTTMNIKTIRDNTNGYHWCRTINLSIQNKDANKTMLEILHMIERFDFNFEIEINLHDGEIVKYRHIARNFPRV